jgi:hypothetical protein
MTINWDAIGAIAEILGAIAVLATLLYLAAQVRQTNLISQSDGTERLFQRFDDANQLLIINASLREALNKASGHTPDELNQVYAFANFKCNLWMSGQTAFSAGRLDRSLFQSVQNDVTVTLDMWPITRDAIDLWRKRYPDVASLEVFDRF